MDNADAPTCTFEYRDIPVSFRLASEQDHISRHLAQSKGFYEQAMLEALAQVLRPGDLVIDAGANIGNHTVFFAKVVGCRVLAFEPVPSTCDILRENVRRNGLEGRVQVFQAALGAAAAHARIDSYDPANVGGTQLGLDESGDIEVRALDGIAREGAVRLVKIDVEGMDLQVLKGARALLAVDRPWVVCEAKGPAEYGPISAFLERLEYVSTACFNATDTYVFLPAGSEAEWKALARHGFGEVIQLQRDTRALGDRIAQLQRYAERIVREAEARLRERAPDLRPLVAQLAEANAARQVLDAERIRLQEETRVCREQLAAAETSLAAREVALDDLRGQLADARDALASREAVLDDLRGQLVDARDALASREVALDDLRGQLGAARDALAERDAALTGVAARLDDAIVELQRHDREHAEALAAVGRQLAAAESALASRESEVELLKRRTDEQGRWQQRAETDLASLRARLHREGLERDRWKQLAGTANASYRAVEQLLGVVSRSITYQLGSVFLLAVTRPSGIVKMPIRLARLIREMRRRHQQMARGEAVNLGVVVPTRIPTMPDMEPTLPQDGPALLGHVAQPSHVDAISTAARVPLTAPGTDGIAPVRLPDLPRQAADLKLAVVMDEFTFASYAPCANVMQLLPTTWREQLDRFLPDMLFIESAWQGEGGAWRGKVAAGSAELEGILRWCRERRIPTVFWNKEDPVHFETFIGTAQRFDHVFTTDIDCIGRYKAALGHDRVYLLPFACQPRSHGPVEMYERKDAFCFAGAYYARYPDRQKDFDTFIDALSLVAPVEIFDRNFGKDQPEYMFPDRYRPLIQGNLPFDQIDLAYKGYRYGINLNSVKQSQTMFARRAFDLLASNTVTISNFSRGLRAMFGDLVVTTDSAGQLLSRLEPLLSKADASYYRRFRLAGLRKVLSEHTYDDRLNYVLSKVSGRSFQKVERAVVVVAGVASDAALAAVLRNYDRQCYRNKRLCLVVADGYAPRLPTDRSEISIFSAATAAALQPAQAWSGDAIAGFCGDDYYGPHYLVDLALSGAYSDAEVVGKTAWYRNRPDGIVLVGDGTQYRPGVSIPLRQALVRVDAWDGSLADFTDSIADGSASSARVLGLDEFNYVRDGSGADAWSAVDDIDGLHAGLPLPVILALAESIGPEDVGVPQGVDVYAGDALEVLFSVPRQESGVALSGAPFGLRLTSSLAFDKHHYVYAKKTLPTAGWAKSGTVHLHLQLRPGVSLDVALIFLDARGQRLGSAVLPSGCNVSAPLPEGANHIRLGLRVKGSGDAAITRLVLGHLPDTPKLQLGRARYLVLSNQYPSYDNLYRNAFVHRRVVGYTQEGLDVDVFCLRNGGALEYREFENVDVTVGPPVQLQAKLARRGYAGVLVHFLDPAMWEVLRDVLDHTQITVWVHGSEVQPWYRRDFNYRDEAERDQAKVLSEVRMAFWRDVLASPHPNLHLVFVSQYFAEEVMEDVGIRLRPDQYSVIHNFIDTDLFAFHPKPADQRFRVLSIRPYASRKYANDLSVEAVLQLSRQPAFERFEFRFIGDGPLFDETLAPIAHLPNVVIERRFLSQGEIAQLHREYGVFLCPTRMDSQGVSRDEAMSSGLVPVTNAVTAIPEFVDTSCGILAPGEDARAMADGIQALASDPALFLRMSAAAAGRARAQCGYAATIRRERRLITAGPSFGADI